MNWLKRIKLAGQIIAPPKKGLIDLIETNVDVITSEQYKELTKWAAMDNNIGYTLTDLRQRFLEFYKLKSDKNELSLSQGFDNLFQCLFNVENGINHSIGGLEVLKKKE